jgi:dTDP-4-amino-4,6-dideoxygalactose transaminase
LAVTRGETKRLEVPDDLFAWPIVTEEDERAVLEVVRRGGMSGRDVTLQFEKEVAEYHGTRHALAFCNGTASLLGGMYGCGVGAGDEVIAPAYTFWATVMPALNLGASIVFADVRPDTLTIDPDDIEPRVTERTKAILALHICGHPADMDPIVEIARRHKLKVIEDVSHAQGGLYKGRMLGAVGDVGCMSVMSWKSLAVGEGGLMVTDDRKIYERAIAFGFHARTDATDPDGEPFITDPDLKRFAGLAIGGYKHRLSQTNSAMGRVQLRRYPERIAEIQRAMNDYWDCLEGVPGVRAHRPAKDSGSTMGGWYSPAGHYVPDELGGLPVEKFIEAGQAEGAAIGRARNFIMHLHPFFQEADVYGHGKPTVNAFGTRDYRRGPGSFPVAEQVFDRAFSVPWFKKHQPGLIEQHADALRRVAENYEELLQTQ